MSILCIIFGHNWSMYGENRIVDPPIRMRRCGRCGTTQEVVVK